LSKSFNCIRNSRVLVPG